MKTPSAFDLDDAVVIPEARLELKHPVTGVPTGVVFRLAGPEHAVRKQRLFALQRRFRAEFEKSGKVLNRDPEDDALEELELMTACTLGWENVVAGGVTIPFSADACRALYADERRAWVRDQVKAALDQRELFIGGSVIV